MSGKCVRTIRDIHSAINCLVATDSYLFAGCKDGKIHVCRGDPFVNRRCGQTDIDTKDV